MLHDLYTARGEALSGKPWTVYPRPQMKRDSCINLNGEWAFFVNNVEKGKILVPFCPESLLSGIKEHFPEGSTLSYRRTFTLPEGFHRGRVLLHIGAADQKAEVFVNGKAVGSHFGGYEAFSLDITGALRPENTLEVRCTDDLRNLSVPYGKQVLKRGGMWYTPVSGIWQTVWLESVPETYIEKLNIENRGTSVTIDIGKDIPGTVTVAGLGEYSLKNGKVTISPENPRLWSPEDPYLYEFTVTAGEDKVESYFALRTLEIKKIGEYRRLCLNGKPYFFHGLLDQGYWPDGLFTPAAPECYADDILAMKKLGFNMLRKHIKVEPEEFYYQCDRLGMVVFQDMVNNGDYGYVRDTVLPTISLTYQKIMPDKGLHKDENVRRNFLAGMKATVNQLKNHPSIFYWTIFNEGWGQFDSDSVYEQLRKLDDTRWIDATSGWFRRKKTDVDSRHVYFRKVNLKAEDKPLVLSEFGGFAYKVEGHIFNTDKEYGYGSYDDLNAFCDAVAKVYMEQVVPNAKKGLCAAVYTQVSDVEDEINGLLTYDRRVEKLKEEKMLPVADALQKAVEEAVCTV
ncbi:MAG: glycoside hydrolase family 2 [Oscillospiraceae bacterium]|nr:glycoside hydrolase family 2 [Oscillospiraceae bacterium]